MAIAGSSLAATCDAASGSHHVALIVEHGDGSTLSKCIAFSSASLTGEQILDQSHVSYTPLNFGGLSDAICQVDGEPAEIPSGCWTGSSLFWELFVSRAGGPWTWSSLGISAQVFHDGDAEGFRYEAQTETSPPKLLGDCPSATPAPSAIPKPTARPAPGSTPRPTPGSSVAPPSEPAANLGAGSPSTVPPGGEPAAGASPSGSSLGDAGGITSSAGPTAAGGLAGSARSAPGSDGGSAALLIAIVAIAVLGGLAALRRRPGQRRGPQ